MDDASVRVTNVTRRFGVTLHAYADADCDAGVALYAVEDGGHAWPGGQPIPEWFAGPTSQSIDATGLMWAFFRDRRLPDIRPK